MTKKSQSLVKLSRDPIVEKDFDEKVGEEAVKKVLAVQGPNEKAVEEAAQTSNAVLIGQLRAPYESEEANQTQLEVAVEMSDDTEKEFKENGVKPY